MPAAPRTLYSRLNSLPNCQSTVPAIVGETTETTLLQPRLLPGPGPDPTCNTQLTFAFAFPIPFAFAAVAPRPCSLGCTQLLDLSTTPSLAGHA